jgi:hypothetical protein
LQWVGAVYQRSIFTTIRFKALPALARLYTRRQPSTSSMALEETNNFDKTRSQWMEVSK